MKSKEFNRLLVQDILEKKGLKVVNNKNMEEISKLLFEKGKISTDVVHTVYLNLLNDKKNESISIKRFIDELMDILFPMKRNISLKGDKSNASLAVNFLGELKKIHKDEKQIYYNLTWLTDIIIKGKLYHTSQTRNISPQDFTLKRFSNLSINNNNFKSHDQIFTNSDIDKGDMTRKNFKGKLKLEKLNLNLSMSYETSEIDNVINVNNQLFNSIDSLNFSVFRLENLMNRNLILPSVSNFIFKKHNLFNIFNERKLNSFFFKIAEGYKKDNPYHNDLHASDILQMCHYFISNSDLVSSFKLNKHEIAAFLLSAIIHDFKHPGFNNNYLINTGSPLAITYNDISVLENYHIAEAFKIINNECNIFQNFSTKDIVRIRKIIIQCILGTDGVKHKEIMDRLSSLVSICKKERNLNFENSKDDMKGIVSEESKNLILIILLHAADIANQGREFKIAKFLSNKCLEEFFNQGDTEKALSLPISYLCDRATVSIPLSQIGFICNVVYPFFEKIIEILPGLKQILVNLKQNELEWKSLTELRKLV